MMANESERPAEDRAVMTNGNRADQSGSSPLPIPTIKITKVSTKYPAVPIARAISSGARRETIARCQNT